MTTEASAPRAWWRLSVFPECLPCVTTDESVAQDWRDAGRTVVELGDLAAERERLCAALKAEDDYCVTDGDYMLDSDDCISVIRGTWTRPDYSLGPNVRGKPQPPAVGLCE